MTRARATVERFDVAVDDVGHAGVRAGRVAVALHVPEDAGRSACIVACHGLSASKDSDKYLLLADVLPAAGLALARFDFRGCGESSGVESDTTIATRIDDVRAVLTRLERHPRLDGRIALLGSSLGGFVAAHVARTRGDGPPLVTWNAPADLADLRPPDGPSGLGAAFYAEVQTGRYASAPAGIRRHLVVQAGLDEVVPVVHADRLRARAAPPTALLVIAGGDHRFTDPEHRRRAVSASVDWFREYL